MLVRSASTHLYLGNFYCNHRVHADCNIGLDHDDDYDDDVKDDGDDDDDNDDDDNDNDDDDNDDASDDDDNVNDSDNDWLTRELMMIKKEMRVFFE